MTAQLGDAWPHSRACGFVPHPHGRACSHDCPTCGEKAEASTRVATYRIKDADVQAIQVTADNGPQIAAWCGGRHVVEQKSSDHTDVAQWVEIPTLSGAPDKAHVGDYVLRRSNGRFAAVVQRVFADVYELLAGVR